MLATEEQVDSKLRKQPDRKGRVQAERTVAEDIRLPRLTSVRPLVTH